MTYLDNAPESYPKGEVYLSRFTGGTPAAYVKCQRHSQGESELTVNYPKDYEMQQKSIGQCYRGPG